MQIEELADRELLRPQRRFSNSIRRVPVEGTQIVAQSFSFMSEAATDEPQHFRQISGNIRFSHKPHRSRIHFGRRRERGGRYLRNQLNVANDPGCDGEKTVSARTWVG